MRMASSGGAVSADAGQFGAGPAILQAGRNGGLTRPISIYI
jgi:hypothetical protein